MYEINRDGCWEWKNNSERGYGIAYANGRRYRAHRYVWELVNGPIPQGLLVCHKCDNRRCVNPDHLFLGTNHDNNHDMINKGRANLLGLSKLAPMDIKTIKRLYRRGESQQAIANQFGVHRTTISKIIVGTTWKG